jgi:hypothetical protein
MGFIVSIGFFLFAGVFWLLASQIKSGALPRNGDFGIRTRLTKSSDESWDAAHKAALPLLSLTAWVALSLGLLTIAISLILHDEWVLLVFVGVWHCFRTLANARSAPASASKARCRTQPFMSEFNQNPAELGHKRLSSMKECGASLVARP